LDEVHSLFEKMEEEIKMAEKTDLVFGLYNIRSFFRNKNGYNC